MSDRLSAKKKKKARERVEKLMDRRAGGEKALVDDEVFDEFGTRQKVARRGLPLKNFETHIQSAAARFARDWSVAVAGTMKGMSWKERVDGGSPNHRAHLERLEAQTRLNEIAKIVGDLQFELVKAVAVFDFSAQQIHDRGGPARVVVTRDIVRALTLVGEYYDKRPYKRDPMMDVLSVMIKEALEEPERL